MCAIKWDWIHSQKSTKMYCPILKSINSWVMRTQPSSKNLHKMTFNHITFNICFQFPLPLIEVDTKAAMTFWWVGETVAVIVPTWVGYEKGQRLCMNLMFHFELWALRHCLFYNKIICQCILSILYVLLACFRIDEAKSSIALMNFLFYY